MQASGGNLKFFETARILYRDEGIIRFWKGAQVIASGCVPAHASYFTMYELLKRYFMVHNHQYELMNTLCIGSLTTFAHDFFIAPSDGTFQKFVNDISL